MDTTEHNTLTALSAQLAAAVAAAAASIAYVDAHPRRDASGIAWDEHHLVTVEHAIEREEEIEILLDGATKANATLVGRDSATDVALLHTQATLAPAQRADPAALRVGTLVLAVGRDEDAQPAASFGVISSLDGPWRTWRGGSVDRFIRPDINLYRGFSGGALVDVAGAVVGMNTWGLSRRTALTLPVPTLERIVDELRAGGRVRRGYLGVALQSVRLPEALRTAHGLVQRSAPIVVEVAPGGPAEHAGVTIGDVVLTLSASTIQDVDDLQNALARIALGSAQSLRILRGGEARELRVVVAEQPRGACGDPSTGNGDE
ncbi:MAG: serine protease [Candidatus Eremiobacteraeota bacterium]|nr:serine protease [Candidatus Eremiobacteraeota bacterium]MBC5802532.1 serine protease [Candidatus Eremiobacteraeota bacterium]MBC5822756.1 serine protease [Candidatus Eremiobacteraeota bacterium]